ncbi:MAG: transposase [Actinomycetota bacterium]
MLYADGKVITPLWKAKPGDTRVDRETGEIQPLRFDADAALHVTGSGEPAWGTRFVLCATRSDDVHGRMILSIAPVAKPGSEAKVALECMGRLAPGLPGALGVIYDGAFRGVHLVELMRQRGLLPIVPVQAAAGGRRTRKQRRERTVLVEPGLYATGGALCKCELDEQGEAVLTPLERIKIEKRPNADGTWRWYGVYLTEQGTLRVRLDTTDEDRAKGFNRSEHLRAIPPSDPDYQRLYPRRSDAESINRALDDSCWLNRAHSVGRERQLVNLIGYALAVNSLALHRHRRTLAPPGQVAA